MGCGRAGRSGAAPLVIVKDCAKRSLGKLWIAERLGSNVRIISVRRARRQEIDHYESR